MTACTVTERSSGPVINPLNIYKQGNVYHVEHGHPLLADIAINLLNPRMLLANQQHLDLAANSYQGLQSYIAKNSISLAMDGVLQKFEEIASKEQRTIKLLQDTLKVKRKEAGLDL